MWLKAECDRGNSEEKHSPGFFQIGGRQGQRLKKKLSLFQQARASQAS